MSYNDSSTSCGDKKENIYAGIVLILVGVINAIVYSILVVAMGNLVKKYPSMIYLISMGIADIAFLLLFTYVGFGIAFCGSFLHNTSFAMLNIIWNPKLYQYILIALNRSIVLVFPLQAARFTAKINTIICVITWIIGIVQQIVFQQWPETYYVFVPQRFGYFYLYRVSGPWVQIYWDVFNNLGIVIPGMLYISAFIFVRCKKTSVVTSDIRKKAEFRLAIGCAVNSFFLLLLNVETNVLPVNGKWDVWRNSIFNMLNSAIGAYLLVAFSREILKALLKLLKEIVIS